MDAARLCASFVLRHRCCSVDTKPIAQLLVDFLVEEPTWVELFASNLPEREVLYGVRWLFARGYEDPRIRNATEDECTYMDVAVGHGFASVVHFLVDHSVRKWTSRGIMDAAAHGHLALLQLMLEKERHRGSLALDAMKAAVTTNQLHIVQYLHDVVPSLTQPPVARLYARKEPSQQRMIPEIAASKGYLAVLQYLWQVDGQQPTPKYHWNHRVADMAAIEGHYEMLQWMYSNTTLRCSSDAQGAAIRGDLALVQFLLGHHEELYVDACVLSMMSHATTAGAYDLLVYLSSLGEYTDKFNDCALVCAAAKGDLDLVKQWSEGSTIAMATTATVVAASRGHLAVVQFLQEYNGIRRNVHQLRAAIHAKYHDVAAFLGEQEPTDAAMAAAVYEDCFSTVHFLYGIHHDYQPQAAYGQFCIRTGNVEMLTYLCENGLTALSPQDLLLDPARNHDEVFTFIFEWLTHDIQSKAQAWQGESLDDVVVNVVASLARRGKLKLIKLLASKYPLQAIDCRQAINNAAEDGHLDVIQYFHTDGYQGFSSNAIKLAARWGSLSIVKYLHQNRTEAFPPNVLDAAAMGGDLRLVEYLHTHNAGATTEAMNNAAKRGHLAIVEFLHENRSEGCTVDAMNGAVWAGHLDVVQFLHENRTEGCTVQAMNTSASAGDLEMVRYLHENRTEGCTTQAMDMAAYYGYLDVVQFLYEHRTEGCTVARIPILAQRQPQIFRYLRERYM